MCGWLLHAHSIIQPTNAVYTPKIAAPFVQFYQPTKFPLTTFVVVVIIFYFCALLFNSTTVICTDCRWQNPAIADVYTEHSCAVNVAKYSPSGFYIASGGKYIIHIDKIINTHLHRHIFLLLV